MNYKEFVKQLSREQRQQLTEKSDIDGSLRLISHLIPLLFTGVLIYFEVHGWHWLIIPHGILMIFLFTTMHEATHRTAFKNKTMNDWVAKVCGVLLFIPAEWFRAFHFAHHRFTQDPERDPELSSGKPTTFLQYLLHVSGIPVWFSQFKTLGMNASGIRFDHYVPRSKWYAVCRESRLMLVIYIFLFLLSVAFTSALLLKLWIIPLIVGQPFLRLYLLAEHGRCPHSEDIFSNTRTIYTTWLIRRLAWNMPFHAEHHAYPNVPFFRLPALNQLIRDSLKTTSPGYCSFNHRYIQFLKNNQLK